MGVSQLDAPDVRRASVGAGVAGTSLGAPDGRGAPYMFCLWQIKTMCVGNLVGERHFMLSMTDGEKTVTFNARHQCS